MKEFTKNEYAAIKRINNTTKVLRTKRDRIKAKINLLQLDVDRFDKEIETWEAPIRNITGGFTSEEVLDGTYRLAPKDEVNEEIIDIEIENN